MEYRSIAPVETHSLRQRILRPHQVLSEMAYPMDDHELSFHGGAFMDNELLGIVSLYPMDRAGDFCLKDWRLRGMAVAKEYQKQGIGKRLVLNGLDYARSRQARSVWCNARTTALDFYIRLGFVAEGDEFDIEGIGPHYVARYRF